MKIKSNTVFYRISLIIILAILTSNCKKLDIIDIGENYGGGIIFYLDETGEHGLVAAPEDQGSYAWGCTLSPISGADGISVGTGYQNTIDIVNGCSETYGAAYICANLELNGYSDWFLPSKDELNLMYVNLKLKGIGAFKSKIKILWWESEAEYWSSSESSMNNGIEVLPTAWYQNFFTGYKEDVKSRNNGCYVRAVRSF